MKNKLLSLFICSLTSIPYLISLKYGLFDLNALSWSMVWNNEVTLWGLVFIIFSIIGIRYYLKKQEHLDKYFYFLLIFSFILITPYLFDFFNGGLGPSSKGDSDHLQPVEILLKGCWGKFPNY